MVVGVAAGASDSGLGVGATLLAVAQPLTVAVKRPMKMRVRMKSTLSEAKGGVEFFVVAEIWDREKTMRTLTFLLIGSVACSGVEGDPSFLKSGDHQFYTVAMQDSCLDGALETLFMPEGPESEHAFSYPIFLPGYEELPSTYTVDLREPFVGMEVRLDSSDGVTLELRGSVMESVLLGSAYGDCTVTMSVDADLLPVADRRLEGTAWISLSDATGSEELCPVFSSDPCEVVLNLRAER